MTRTSTVSVVVAAYNEEAHIPRLIASLRGQSLPPNEVIVIDDGSTDSTAPIAESGGASVIQTEHRGPAHARNVGARAASGDILVFLDGDMAAAPEFVDRVTAPIRGKPQAVGTFSKEIYIGNPENQWARCYAVIRRLAFPRLLPPEFPNRWANYRAVRRADFLAVGGYDDVGYGEDMTLAPKLGELALAAPGAVCFHFNPSRLSEIFENGRWIGRGHDIADVANPWIDNSPWTAWKKAMHDLRAGAGWRILAARLAYHLGLSIGLLQRQIDPTRHSK
jgi:glycosyltransferase involved in cell wall biosynthesis